MTDDATLPVPIDYGQGRVSTLDQLAAIPEEEILQKQKSARTRRAYRLDVQHFITEAADVAALS